MPARGRIPLILGYLSFNAGIMFFIGLALSLAAPKAAVTVEGLRVIGAGVLGALVLVAAGFLSAARVELARRAGEGLKGRWVVPAVLVGVPLGHEVGAGVAPSTEVLMVAAVGAVLGAAALAWTALRRQSEVQA